MYILSTYNQHAARWSGSTTPLYRFVTKEELDRRPRGIAVIPNGAKYVGNEDDRMICRQAALGHSGDPKRSEICRECDNGMGMIQANRGKQVAALEIA